MLIGRFLDDRADAGDRRLARGQEDRARPRPAPSRPTAALFVGLLVGVILIVGGLTFFPALALGPIVEHLAMLAGQTSTDRGVMPWKLQTRKRRRSRPARPGDPRARRSAGLRQARPARADQEPGDVRGRGRGGADHRPLPARPRRRAAATRLHVPDHALALVHRAVRQLRRGGGRGPRQGAGRRLRRTRTETAGQAARPRRRAATTSSCPAPASRSATSCWSRPAT